jgi:hypothetical protein
MEVMIVGRDWRGLWFVRNKMGSGRYQRWLCGYLHTEILFGRWFRSSGICIIIFSLLSTLNYEKNQSRLRV